MRSKLGTIIIAFAVTVGANGQDASDPAIGVLQDNIVVLLDASGSMRDRMSGGRSRMDTAKQALRQVMGDVAPTTNVGLLVFSGSNVSDPWVYPLGPLDRAQLDTAIDHPRPGGRTPLGKYMKIAADRLLEQRSAQYGYGSYRLLILTDGQAGDPRLVDQYLPDIVSRGLTVDVIGLDMKESHALATRVHSYQRGDDPESLVQAMREVFAEIDIDDATTADDSGLFELIGSMSNESAMAAITALSRTGNEPISGRKPRSNGSSQSGTTPAGGGPSNPGPASGGGSSRSSLVPMVMVVMIVTVVAIAMIIRVASRLGGRS